MMMIASMQFIMIEGSITIIITMCNRFASRHFLKKDRAIEVQLRGGNAAGSQRQDFEPTGDNFFYFLLKKLIEVWECTSAHNTPHRCGVPSEFKNKRILGSPPKPVLSLFFRSHTGDPADFLLC